MRLGFPSFKRNVVNLKAAFVQTLSGPCASYQASAQGGVTHQPLPLIIDDLERILVKPSGGGEARTTVEPDDKPVLEAVLEAFAEAGGHRILR